MSRFTANQLGSCLTAIGLLVSLAGMHLIGQRLPPKQAYMRYHEPEIWGVSRKDVYFMRNWLIASQLAGVGALIGFALLSKASRTQRNGHAGLEKQQESEDGL